MFQAPGFSLAVVDIWEGKQWLEAPSVSCVCLSNGNLNQVTSLQEKILVFDGLGEICELRAVFRNGLP